MSTVYKLSGRGFTLIELLVASTILVILISVATSNFSNTQLRARDANRQDTVREYRSSLELYKSARGNYFVYTTKRGDPTICIGGKVPDTSLDEHQYRFFGNNAISCVGYKSIYLGGGGQGRMTREGPSTVGGVGIVNYSQTSIADALVDEGFLTSVRTDPLVKDFTSDTGDHRNDFILTLCKDDGTEPTANSEATQFTVYTQLEGTPSPNRLFVANQSCGGIRSGHSRHTIK